MNWVDVGLAAIRLAIGCWLLLSVRPLRRERPATIARRDVSVIVPARDEAESIGNLLGSIPSEYEVVVVDDESSDGTAAVAERLGARVIASGPLPDGWIGKSWACARGAADTDGTLVVFADADVRFGPDGLDAVVAALTRHGGLVSVQPFHEPVGPVESLASMFNVVSYGGTDAGSPLGRWRGVRGAFGPVLATTRDDYESVGGHDAVRGALLDDIALSERYRAAGLPVTIRAGADAVRFRMYPGGFRQLLEGFTKNVASGAEAVRWTTTALLVAWLSLLMQAAVAPFLALATGDGLGAAVALYSVVAAQFWWMARRLGRFGPLTALTFPVPLGLFLFVFVRSMVATVRGSVSWRGRRISTEERDGRPR